jgi:putative FmdB family regulatory protein
MPLYEYECEICGNRFERIQSVHDEPIKQCPNCSANALHKIFHPAGIIFKGSGWYINDSRKPSTSETKSPSSTSKPDGETKSSSETKTETKTETKKETSDPK